MRRQTITEYYTPEFLHALDAMSCQHGTPRGSRYCALCRHWLRKQRRGGDVL